MTSFGDNTDAPVNARFIRNLALSLSGGALLAFLGAGVAHADTTNTDDVTTQSGGTSNTGTGDATAVGNKAGNNTTQTVTVSGNLGSIQVINQKATVTNTGTSTANTGGNTGTGNGSTNTGTGTQTGTSTGAGSNAHNTGATGNNSSGTANIATGNASAVGNDATTNVVQEAHGNAVGRLGGILIIHQDANVTNSGIGLANTGGNTADGNTSINDARLDQTAASPAGQATNTGAATNNAEGNASVATGNASAVGNKSNTNIVQQATGTAGGALGGLVIIDQNVNVLNQGTGIANSGGNNARGNAATSTANLGQDSGTGAGGPGDVAIASNDAEASNKSDGTAAITTGNASAVGNDSTTSVRQVANADIVGAGFSTINQNADVTNQGIGLANTGGNTALGNGSQNQANAGDLVDPIAADSHGGTDVNVIGNFGMAANESNGSATIATGDASAQGNRSATDVAQSAHATGGSLSTINQTGDVTNTGFGAANSGVNTATGNDSDNDATARLAATMANANGDVAVTGGFGLAENISDGSAAITTGNASAQGNTSTTSLAQELDPTSTAVFNQNASITNAGNGVATTGGNTATGNTSENDATQNQSADVGVGAGNVALNGSTIVSSNDGEASNTSDGSASVATGAATAGGNDATSTLTQAATGGVTASGIITVPQTATITNNGTATVNTGGNVAEGNWSENFADSDQHNDVGDSFFGDVNIEADTITVANTGTAKNVSDGSASISTGAGTATGNDTASSIAQTGHGTVAGSGGAVLNQNASISNFGTASVNTGGNTATGNLSDNEAELDQDNHVGDAGDDVNIDAADGAITVANTGTASNTSDGSASISTGAGTATGNTGSSAIDQSGTSGVGGSGFVTSNQNASITNIGIATVNTGDNDALGNESFNDADLDQEAYLGDAGDDTDIDAAGSLLTNANTGTASNDSDGSASISTGAGTATGNASTSALGQSATNTVGGSGPITSNQQGSIVNFGIGLVNTGDNGAVGNDSFNVADLDQDAELGDADDDVDITADGITNANTGTAANASDGSASITTGAGTATGNASTSSFSQDVDNAVAGSGPITSNQEGGVINIGIGLANTGLNGATGNDSFSDIDLDQHAEVGDSSGDDVDIDLDALLTNANTASASNDSDGSASITTGAGKATGNASNTDFAQTATNSLTGSGPVTANQEGLVLNGGIGLVNTGLNGATGNDSFNSVDSFDQDAIVGEADDDVDIEVGGPLTNANTSTASNTSNGTAEIKSGAGDATGNASSTDFAQGANNTIGGSGPITTNQEGLVLNGGLGIANTGFNDATGNDSSNDIEDFRQEAEIGSNSGGSVVDDVDIDVDGPLTNANTATQTNKSDGTAKIHSGGAQGTGNVSATTFEQGAVSNIAGSGPITTNQEGAIVNLGAGVANSGLNEATGNDSSNDIDVEQQTELGADNAGDVVIDVDGPLTSANTLTALNDSDGTADVRTGGALATGNVASSNTLSQTNTSGIGGSGPITAAQDGDIVNIGIAVANTGLNEATGNDSFNDNDSEQENLIGSRNGDDVTITVDGPLTGANTADVSNVSDGTACVCTGDAMASGNIATNDLNQNLDLNVGVAGPVTVDASGDITNFGFALVNTGLNTATGNDSFNDADVDQENLLGSNNAGTTVITPGSLQTGANTQTSTNDSNGTAKIGTGSAGADGNVATNDLVQDGELNGGLVTGNIVGNITNTGTANANTGGNQAFGNTSTNDITVDQDTTGFGSPTNTANNTNKSDGTAIVGDPDCDPEPVPGPDPVDPEEPEVPVDPTDPTKPEVKDPDTGKSPSPEGLARTGSPVQTEAMLALLMLMAGFGFRRAGRRQA